MLIFSKQVVEMRGHLQKGGGQAKQMKGNGIHVRKKQMLEDVRSLGVSGRLARVGETEYWRR